VRSQADDAGLTKLVAGHIAKARAIALPETVVEKAKHHILDTLAATVSGSELEPGMLGRAYVERLGGRAEASVVGASLRTNAVNAALANGMAAHADETDDAHPRSITHPGCAVIPAALAVAERQGCSGNEFLRAVVVGYDVCARTGIMLGAGRFLTEAGFDTHAFGGTMGASAAAGALVVRDPVEAAYVLSFAAQQASGLATLFRDQGHVEKAFVFAGMPARSGVAAATMVQAGMTGVTNVLDGEPSFLSAFRTEPTAATVFDDLGRTFEIQHTNIKRWSVGSPAQAILDSLEELMRTHEFAVLDIKEVQVRLPEEGARIVNDRRMPSVNVQHLTAVMLVDGGMTFAVSHSLDRMHDPAVLEMRSKVKLVPSPELSRAEPARQGIVEIRLRDGRTLRHHTRAVRGTIFNPMSRDEVAAKAADLIAPILGREQSESMISCVWKLDALSDIRMLTPLFQPKVARS
jgi:2-methylcitrate dehydratase PrpD